MNGREGKIRDVAYGMWEAANKIGGRDLEFWLLAEHRVNLESDAEMVCPKPQTNDLVQPIARTASRRRRP